MARHRAFAIRFAGILQEGCKHVQSLWQGMNTTICCSAARLLCQRSSGRSFGAIRLALRCRVLPNFFLFTEVRTFLNRIFHSRLEMGVIRMRPCFGGGTFVLSACVYSPNQAKTFISFLRILTVVARLQPDHG